MTALILSIGSLDAAAHDGTRHDTGTVATFTADSIDRVLATIDSIATDDKNVEKAQKKIEKEARKAAKEPKDWDAWRRCGWEW